jgi:hypothetical protein
MPTIVLGRRPRWKHALLVFGHLRPTHSPKKRDKKKTVISAKTGFKMRRFVAHVKPEKKSKRLGIEKNKSEK